RAPESSAPVSKQQRSESVRSDGHGAIRRAYDGTLLGDLLQLVSSRDVARLGAACLLWELMAIHLVSAIIVMAILTPLLAYSVNSHAKPALKAFRRLPYSRIRRGTALTLCYAGIVLTIASFVIIAPQLLARAMAAFGYRTDVPPTSRL